MKSPPRQIVDDEAHQLTERFIEQYARRPAETQQAPAVAEA
jgi:hypothetical protein